MANFTKGEWYVIDNNVSYKMVFSGDKYICSVQNIDNAHLIKTSPKMYNLLHKIMVEHCNTSVLYNEIDELLEEARGE